MEEIGPDPVKMASPASGPPLTPTQFVASPGKNPSQKAGIQTSKYS